MMTAAKPAIDFARLSFPTDELTIRMLRERHPHVFDSEPTGRFAGNPRRNSGYYERGSIDGLIGSTINFERMLAEMAYRAELGLPKMEGLPVADRSSLIDSLTNSYVFLGVTSGKHEARAMLKDIETQARKQGREHGGRSR
jgi:hypothetical protein